MKKMIGKTRETMRNYWRNLMDSTQKKMSTGAQYINRIISWARRENWRGNKEQKKK